MKIFYDGEIFNRQKVGGINRYFFELISRLPQGYKPVLTTVSPCYSALPQNTTLRNYSYKRFSFKPGRLSFALEPYYFELIENLVNPDIFHPTYHYLLTRRKLISKKRHATVLTVYDLLQEIVPDLIDPERVEIEFKKAAILAADVIICISENTKKDLIDHYNISSEKIYVTHLASNLRYHPSANTLTCEKPYLLYVGSRLKHKNFKVLLEAFNNISRSIKDIDLYVVSSPWSKIEAQEIEEKKLTDRIHLVSYVDDNYLANLYGNCLCFIYPSIYEGFGIPLLEAMQCQAPVIASGTSSIPEVVGDAALLFNPYSVDELTDMLKFIINHSDVRNSLALKGVEQAKKFSWDTTVNETLKVYQLFK